MYSVTCETCSETFEANTYGTANGFFMEHAEHHHDVELLNVAHEPRPSVSAD